MGSETLDSIRERLSKIEAQREESMKKIIEFLNEKFLEINKKITGAVSAAGFFIVFLRRE